MANKEIVPFGRLPQTNSVARVLGDGARPPALAADAHLAAPFARAPENPENKVNYVAAVMRNTRKGVSMTFAVDLSDSTSNVVALLKQSAVEIMEQVRKAAPDTNFSFGRFDGGDTTQEIPKVELSSDLELLSQPNRGTNGWQSTMSEFLAHLANKNHFEAASKAGKQSVLVMFGDARGVSNKDLATGIENLKRNKVMTYMLYEQTNASGSEQDKDREWLLENIVNPLGKNGVMIDFRKLDPKIFAQLLTKCGEYTSFTKTSTAGSQISFSDFLKLNGFAAAADAITQGSKPLELGHQE